MAVLLANLQTFEPHLSAGDVMAYLAENGFVHVRGNEWECEDVSLELLHESEIVRGA